MEGDKEVLAVGVDVIVHLGCFKVRVRGRVALSLALSNY
jgi:hypothetical protein